MKPLICKLIGHRFYAPSLEQGVSHCERCGDSDYAYGTVAWTIPSWFFYHKWRVKMRVESLLSKISNRLNRNGDEPPF